MAEEKWLDAGPVEAFLGQPVSQFPQFPYVAHSRDWTAEDMERNADVQRVARGGRKAHALAAEE